MPENSSPELLIVDDEDLNRRLTALQLLKLGYRVSQAESGARALAMVTTRRFDLVLLDIDIPGMNGLDVVEKIRMTHSRFDAADHHGDGRQSNLQPGGSAAAIMWVEVNDGDPGLTDDNQAKLFQKYVHLCNRPTGNEESSGVGLALCKELISQIDSEIGARDNPQGGATFWLRLPLAK
jgi:CheY-like chemotaxis protein